MSMIFYQKLHWQHMKPQKNQSIFHCDFYCFCDYYSLITIIYLWFNISCLHKFLRILDYDQNDTIFPITETFDPINYRYPTDHLGRSKTNKDHYGPTQQLHGSYAGSPRMWSVLIQHLYGTGAQAPSRYDLRCLKAKLNSNKQIRGKSLHYFSHRACKSHVYFAWRHYWLSWYSKSSASFSILC